MEKILTVIIPTYNMEMYLTKCLNSLLVRMSLMDYLEVLIINDGSNDSSSEIAHRYESIYPEVYRVVDKENGNYGSCINRGVQEASGKYVKILDADDEFITHALEKLLVTLLDVNVDMVLTNVFSHDPNGNMTRDISFSIPADQIIKFKEVYSDSFTYNMCMHAITYKLSLLKDINYYQSEGISYTDNEWACIPMQKVSDIYYINDYLYSYLRGREGQTMDPAVVKKNIGHHIIGIRHMAESVSKAKSVSFENECFLYSKLLERIHLVYGTKLFDNSRCVDKSDIIELDKLIIEKYPFLARKMESLSYGSSMKGYIRKWRKSNYSKKFLLYKKTVVLYKWLKKHC